MSSRLFSLLALAVPVVLACAGAAHAEVTVFSDHFDDGAGCSDLSPWTTNDGSRVGVNTMTSNSGNCSLFIHGAGITATTPTMDLAHPSADLSLWVRKGDDSFSDEPGINDDLELQYRNSSGSWVQLYFFDAGAYAGGQIISGTLTLPSAALHSTAAFRLYQHGGGTGEYWHLDDFTVTAPDPLEVTSTTDTDTIGTLRYAINWANANSGEDAITFDIPGSGPHVITLTSALPQITDAGISIDGSTQDGASCGTAFNSYGGVADRDLRIGIDANGQSGLDVTAENVTIRGIALGNTSAEGVVVNGNNFALHCSHVGTDAAGTASLGTGTSGIFLSGAQNAAIGDGTAAGRNLVGNAGNIGLYVRNSTATIAGNLIGVANNGLDAGNTSRGIYIHKSTATITGNVIANSSQSGVGLVSVGGSAAILSNSIYDNDKLGIDLQGGTADSYGVGTNDAGDTDSGPNDYLNHPVINRITADGSSSIEYDFNLDVPSSGNGYRIEFFRDTSPDPSGHGEGEIFLGALDISHSGGDTRFTGTLALGETVSPGDTITTTATRKTGPSSHDITSEFGANATALSPLVVSTTADSGTGSLRSAIAHANANAGDDAITFSIPGSGPHVIALNSTLTITDAGVSLDGTTQPGTTCGNAQTGVAHDLTVELDGGGDWITVLQIDASNVSVQGIAFTHANSMGLEIVSGSGNSASCNNFGLGADGVTLSAVGAGGQPAVRIAGTGAVMSNNVLAQSGGDGFKVETGASALISGNRVYGSGYDGVSVDGWALSAAIIGNAIYDNNERPIDLGATDGVNANDVGDGDTGPNDLLNFPEIAEVAANGGTSFSYDFNLDVPASANGYRIDFFKSSSADPTGYGEGETFLGALDIAHSGGSQNFTGTFSASATLAVGEIVTATTTRKTGAASYDITSEYSGAVAATEAPAPLVVTSTGDTDTLGTLRYAINWANANAADDEITFNIAGAGPHTIALSSALPVLTDDGITIDGTSQSGASCGNLKDGTPHDLRIHLQGASQAFHGIEMNATGLRIEGLSLTDFNNGIRGRGGADSAQLQCNYVGVEPDGSTAGANGQGIYLLGATSGTTIFNNLISASTQSGVLLASTNGLSNITLTGNLIGTNESGTSAIPNTSDGIRVNTTNASSNITVFGNVLSGNGDNGLELANVATATVQANIIGLDRSGTADLGNGTDGIEISGGSGITVGGDLALYRNVISGNGRSGISLIDANTGTVVAGNHIGTDASGFSRIQNDADGINGDSITSLTVGGSTSAHRNVISGNFGDGIFVDGASTGLTIRNNWIGVDASGNAALGNQDENVQLEETGVTGALLQDNVISGASGATAGGSSYGVILYLGSQATFLGNRIGVGADGVTALQNDTAGLAVHGSTALATIGDGTVAGENIISSNGGPGLYVIGGAAIVRGGSISNNGAQGVRVNGGSFASVGTVYGGNGGLAIDLGNDGVTANDAGDGDSGPSNLLNFPVVNRIDADGSTTVGYDFSLDVPSSANGYRVEFFRTASADATGYGEGETLLAALDIAHSGGDTRFSGSFTASAAVSVGDIVTAIATRKTGAGSHDITSEFSLSYTVTDETPANLAATKSVAVLDDGLIGGDDTVAIPGSTLRYQIALSNTGEGAADAGSTVIVDEIPSNGALKVADFGGFPGTGPVLFSDGSPSSGLSYTFGSLGSGADDIQFSSDNGSSWTYAPSDSGDGTDPAVTHIRLTPGGAFAGGSGTPPSASIAYDVVLF